MPKGYSLHIGLNKVNPTQYEGWDGKLKFAEDDALAMLHIARNQNFEQSQLLLTAMATRDKVLSEIQNLTQLAKAGDLVFISYSGHGSFIPDLNGDEDDGLDETWCCFDGMVIDDELLHLWSQFKAGVRVLLISDSCHSGDIAKGEDDPAWVALNKGAKFLPIEKSLPVFKKHIEFYTKIAQDTPTIDPHKLSVRVKQIGGCATNSFSYEGNGNGELTLAVKAAYADGTFKGNYAAFFDSILQKIATKLQTPVLQNIGAADPDFDAATPFMVEPDRTIMPDFAPPKADNDIRLLVDFGTNVSKSTPSPSNRDASTVKSADFHQNYAIAGRDIAVFNPTSKGAQNAWDAAHQLYDELKANGQSARFVEPDFGHETGIAELSQQSQQSKGSNMFLNTWPYPKEDTFDKMWHLGNDFSQLASARDSLMGDAAFMAQHAEKPVRIAHIDTGFFPHKDFTPENLQIGLCKSFIDGEAENLGVDFITEGSAHNWLDKIRESISGEQQGHGTATLALLAGPKVDSPKGLEGFSGYIGAVPFAEVISIRIQDSVALLKTSAFEKAVYYAVEQGCDVITMSMAGAPSRRWAEAVNYAYEHGVTIVSATGNSWREGMTKYLPTYLLFPARFERVIGAAGVTYSQQPYVFDANDWEEHAKMAGGINMQGNCGPEEQMHHIIAAYTPNVFWAETGQEENPPKPYFVMTGGGTSSATPQVAAAAAMWIAKHRSELIEKGYAGNWQQVEAVRMALFNSADAFGNRFFKYMGRGALKAGKALLSSPVDALYLKKSPEADIPFAPLMQTLFGLLKSHNKPDEVKQEMLALELSQLVVTEPSLEAFGAIDFFSTSGLNALTDAQHQNLKNLISQNPNASTTLKEALAA